MDFYSAIFLENVLTFTVLNNELTSSEHSEKLTLKNAKMI